MKLKSLIKLFEYSEHSPKVVIADDKNTPLIASDTNSIYTDLFIKESAGISTPLDANVIKIEFVSIKFIKITIKE